MYRGVANAAGTGFGKPHGIGIVFILDGCLLRLNKKRDWFRKVQVVLDRQATI
jgi:hypothetical protein